MATKNREASVKMDSPLACQLASGLRNGSWARTRRWVRERSLGLRRWEGMSATQWCNQLSGSLYSGTWITHCSQRSRRAQRTSLLYRRANIFSIDSRQWCQRGLQSGLATEHACLKRPGQLRGSPGRKLVSSREYRRRSFRRQFKSEIDGDLVLDILQRQKANEVQANNCY